MKYVFFGSPEFAEGVLRELTMMPALVVTNPDRPVGRKRMLTPPPVKIAAARGGIPTLQPERVGDATADLRGFDFFVVAAYAQIIPSAILSLAARGAIGVHPSLLPRHRGASPIQTAILQGDGETGVSLYLLDAQMDRGPILAKDAVSVLPDETYSELEARLSSLGGRMLNRFLNESGSRAFSGTPQDEAQATYTAKFTTQDAFVSAEDLGAAQTGHPSQASMVYAKIRAFEREPGAWTIQNGKRIKLLRATLANGRLKLTRIQTEGKGPRDV